MSIRFFHYSTLKYGHQSFLNGRCAKWIRTYVQERNVYVRVFYWSGDRYLSEDIVLEVNGIGYQLLSSNPYRYHVSEEEVKVYVQQIIREDGILAFCFSND